MVNTQRLFIVFALLFIAMASCRQQGAERGSFDEAKEKKAVWKAVETRFQSWKDNDYDGHMSVYHPDFRRWSLHDRKLMKKEDFIHLWESMKNNEQVLDMELEPIEILFYGDGSVAVAHFLSTESFLWTGEEYTSREGIHYSRGSVHTVNMRWSDVMVKEGGGWRYAGGHRDHAYLPEGEQ